MDEGVVAASRSGQQLSQIVEPGSAAA